MKIIITEKQKNLLFESNISSMQKLVDLAMEQYKLECENQNVDTYACEELELVEKVVVVEVLNDSYKKQDGTTQFYKKIIVDCYFNFIRPYHNLDEFSYSLDWFVRNIIGKRAVNVEVRNTINTREKFDW